MKKINLKNIKTILEELNADLATQELITNNVELYNDLIREYKNDDKHSAYLMYQINQLIVKQIKELKVLKIRTSGKKGKNNTLFETEYLDE